MAPGLRDFLYLDVDRVRSLLAQLDGGVVEKIVQGAKEGSNARAGARFFGIFDLGGNLVRERASEQTKTLQDATFLLFEEAADEAGLFADLPIGDATAWDAGEVHDRLQQAQLVRCTAPARILDAQLVRQRVDRFLDWMRIVTSFDASEQLARTGSSKQRDRALDKAMVDYLDGTDPDEIRNVGKFIELFLGGQILLRQFPCGSDHPGYAFTGTLLDRPGYLQEERDALFAKYGSAVSTWTLVGQVATVPHAEEEEPRLKVFDERADKIDRTQFEELGANLMRFMEQLGVAEGPRYPSIAVTPLALFREVPTGSGSRAAPGQAAGQS